ncbi:MAG: glycosyltransferase family 2 protein [Gammaproteobacteria bacterium]|nr:glycosyltransferase family 2 protein [Gammaproteobacteria bacterium]
MNITIGLFAHDEATALPGFLNTLFRQSIFGKAGAGLDIRIVCLANGCSDDTAVIAERAFTGILSQPSRCSSVSCVVAEIKMASKANAWNELVHLHARETDEYILCIDADITLVDEDCLIEVVRSLDQAPQAHVAVDRPVKMSGGWWHKRSPVSRMASMLTREKNRRDAIGPAICGQLFCGRAKIFREIWLPTGLVRVMDGFIRAMVTTNCLTTPEEQHRVIEADTHHLFEGYRSPLRLFIHNRNLLVGLVANFVVYEFLRDRVTPEAHAGELISALNAENPLWMSELVRERLSARDRWRFLLAYTRRPLISGIRSSRAGRLLAGFLLALLRAPLAVAADRQLRLGRFEW